MAPSPSRVMVTGAGGGLGKAIAEAFLAAGARVTICDVNKERLGATEGEWAAAGHDASRFLAAVADVTDEASVQRLVADTVAKFGGLDVLVNNAAIMDDFSPVGSCGRDLWDRVMGVNLLGPYNTMRAAIAQFQNQKDHGGGGVIVNICSVAAREGHSAGAAYTASKHALLGLSRNTAFAYSEQDIYSIAMLLGGMSTNITDSMKGGIDTDTFERQQAAHTKFDPERHLVDIESVARYIVFVSERKIAKGLNGSAVEMTNNFPEA